MKMTEEVRGVIIGPITTDRYYTFHEPQTGSQFAAGRWFSSDAEAERWFRKFFPEQYRKGVEMRCHD